MEDEKSRLLHSLLKKDVKKEEKPCEDEIMKQRLLGASEISLILDTYDDIFSDFDPRPFSQRALSDDFLLESKRAARDKILGMELKFLIPKNKKNGETENIVKKRLHEHFKKHHELLEKEIFDTTRLGIIFVIIGFALMSGAAAIKYFLGDSFLWTILLIITEPSGWFTVWTGFDHIFWRSSEKKKELEFYRKMSKADISFIQY
jgi:hypothetical protein